MLQLFFKVLRKLGYFKNDLDMILFRLKHYSLYSSRITIGNEFKKGRFFSLNFDLSNSKIAIGNNVQFRDFCVIRSGENGKLTIGNNVFFNNNCSINCLYEIEIGNDNQFGENVKFYDANHQYKDESKLISEQGYNYGGISIGNNCWIGSNVCFLKNVMIGDNVIIGAGCTVYKNIPSNQILINKQQLITKEIKEIP